MPDEIVVSTKETLGSYDAIETAKPGEPLFPIQGGDPFGPPTVLHWAKLAREAGMAEPDEKKADALLRKATEAEQVAWVMQEYQRGEQKVEATRTQYNEPSIEIDDSQGEERAVREARIKSADRLHNIVANGTDVGFLLDSLGVCYPESTELHIAMATIKRLAYAIEPRRGNERS